MDVRGEAITAARAVVDVADKAKRDMSAEERAKYELYMLRSLVEDNRKMCWWVQGRARPREGSTPLRVGFGV